jgi:hypothetical protein
VQKYLKVKYAYNISNYFVSLYIQWFYYEDWQTVRENTRVQWMITNMA